MSLCCVSECASGQPLSPTAGAAPGSAGGRSQEVLLGFIDGTWSMLVMGEQGLHCVVCEMWVEEGTFV